VAKVSDFGLSKTFYDNVRYKKRFRHYVPWKWMAIEYLKDACFTMKSDVWSYGVVLWEIFSLGQEPYAGKSIEEVISQIKTGYRLPCPEEVVDVAWADDVYNDVMRKCWDADPSTRCSFGEIVNSLEKLMDSEELTEYRDCSDKCRSKKELMLDDSTR
jgi:serine/threonine protein kinase